jgi:PAS domain S-box-containing protein
LVNTSAQPESRVAVVGTTPDGIVTLWSRGAERLFDLAADEALGALLTELADWHSRPGCADAYDGLGIDDVYVYHNAVTTRSGHGFKIKSTATLARDSNGHEEFLIASTPLTAGLGSEGPAGQSRRLVSSQVDVTLFCAPDGTVEYAGSAIRRVFGELPRQVIGNNMAAYVCRDDQLKCQPQWETALAHPGQTFGLTARIRRGDGQLRWVEFTVTNLMDDPAVAAMSVGVHDVSEYHEAADLLAVTEQTLRSVLGSSVEGVWIIEPSGNTVFANARMAELLDVNYADLVSDQIEAALDQSLVRMIRSHVGERPTGSREEYEVPFTRRDGRLRWLRLAVVPNYDRYGVFSESIVLCADITDVRHRIPDLPLHRASSGSSRGAFGPAPARPSTPPIGRPLLDEPETSADLGLLSPREHDIVLRLLNGDRVPAIAADLFVSQSTVRNQLSSVFRKFRVRSQQELISLLRK